MVELYPHTLSNGRPTPDFSWDALISGLQLRKDLSEAELAFLQQELGGGGANAKRAGQNAALPVALRDGDTIGNDGDGAAAARIVGHMANLVFDAMPSNGQLYRFVLPALETDDGTVRRGLVGLACDGQLVGWESPTVWT